MCSLCATCVQLVCSLCVACVWHRMYVAMSMPCFGSGIAQVCRSIEVHACACVRACVCIVWLLWKSARWLGLGLKPSGLTHTQQNILASFSVSGSSYLTSLDRWARFTFFMYSVWLEQWVVGFRATLSSFAILAILSSCQ